MREYTQQRDEKRTRERTRLQTRLFAGITSLLSLGVVFFAIWDENFVLLTTSGTFYALSSLQFLRKSRIE
jgi:hypothetical protein